MNGVLSLGVGMRTAWSASVMAPFGGRIETIPASGWYDEKHINSAVEDAAEMALRRMKDMNEGSQA